MIEKEKQKQYELNPEKELKNIINKELSILRNKIWKEKVERYEKDIERFVLQSITNTLPEYLWRFNAKNFDRDDIKWFSEEELWEYLNKLYKGLFQLIEVWWYDKLKEVYKDVKDIHWYEVDLFLADKSSKIINRILWDWSWWNDLLKKIWGYSEEEIKKMEERKFNIFSWDSLKETITLVLREIPDNIRWIVKFFADLPSALILLPRYFQYESESLSGDKEAKLKIEILSEDNVVLSLLNLVWPEWEEKIKKLVELVKSGTQWAVAMTVVSIFGLLAGWAGVVRIWAKLWEMEKLEGVAKRVENIANKIDWTINTGWANVMMRSATFMKLRNKLKPEEDIVLENARLNEKERISKAEEINLWNKIFEVKRKIQAWEVISQKLMTDLINDIVKYNPDVIEVFYKKPVAIYNKSAIPEELYWKIDKTKYSEDFLKKCDYVIVQEVDWQIDVYPIENDKLEKMYEKIEDNKLEKDYETKYDKSPSFIVRKKWTTEMIKIFKILWNVKWKLETSWWDTQDFAGKDYIAFIRGENGEVKEVYKVEADSEWLPAMYVKAL